ncbi:hypothetical protein NIES4074_20050 [Cylindrospermum sp. NIES-4074]|nr:hypothetical protein NIES4074_20050 [Cylindrospermum sp. NIES-4074]
MSENIFADKFPNFLEERYSSIDVLHLANIIRSVVCNVESATARLQIRSHSFGEVPSVDETDM